MEPSNQDQISQEQTPTIYRAIVPPPVWNSNSSNSTRKPKIPEQVKIAGAPIVPIVPVNPKKFKKIDMRSLRVPVGSVLPSILDLVPEQPSPLEDRAMNEIEVPHVPAEFQPPPLEIKDSVPVCNVGSQLTENTM